MWTPNTQWKSLYSHLLDRALRVRVSTTALRCIDKAGGLDAYVLYTKQKDLASESVRNETIIWK